MTIFLHELISICSQLNLKKYCTGIVKYEVLKNLMKFGNGFEKKTFWFTFIGRDMLFPIAL